MSFGRGEVSGIVGEDIAVLPDMHPTREGEVTAAKGAVAEVGGQLAHLATVSREAGKPLMVLPDACRLLTPGMHVTLNPGRCEIVVHNDEPPPSEPDTLKADHDRYRAALQHIADGNLSPSIRFARLVLEGKSVTEAHAIERDRMFPR